MGSNAKLLDRMVAAGVTLADAHWYHTVGRARQFRGPHDVQRARAILKMVAKGKP